MERDQQRKRAADPPDQIVPGRLRLQPKSPDVVIMLDYGGPDPLDYVAPEASNLMDFLPRIQETIKPERRKQVIVVEDGDTATAQGGAKSSALSRKTRVGVSDGGGGDKYWADKFYDDNPFAECESRILRNLVEGKITKDLGKYDGLQRRALQRASDYAVSCRQLTDSIHRNDHDEKVTVLGQPEEFTVYLGFLSNMPESQICKQKGFPELTFSQMKQNSTRFFEEHNIMFVFPTDRKSQVRPDAPTLTVFDVRTIMSELLLHRRYVDTVVAYLETIRITFHRDLVEFKYSPQDSEFFGRHFKDPHNLKRMCRLLRSLKLLHPLYAVQLLQVLMDMLYCKVFTISQASLALWMGEVDMSSTLPF